MTGDTRQSKAWHRKRQFGLFSVLTLVVLFINALIGKYRVATGTGTAAPLDGIPEFVILILSVASFVACILNAELVDEQTDKH